MQLRFPFLILALGLLGNTAQAVSSASANGYARGDSQIGCSTCPHFPLTLNGTPVQSVTSAMAAQVDYLGQPLRDADNAPYTLGGEVEYHASAAFEGALARPVLGAYARADNEPAYVIADPRQPMVGIDLYAATAEASTRQTYTYFGPGSATYRFDFHVDGLLSSARATAFGSAALYSGKDPSFETGLIDFGYSEHSGTGLFNDPRPFSGDFSVSVSVDTGASFLLISRLSAGVQMTYNTTDVVADAFHTMRLTGISGGDPALLTTAVPEPGAALLFTLGLVGLVGLRRRQP
ncbi:MAG: PEP-CTERM sorting domain-containing protein [Rubrivivax sp.]|nr:MAG: PEP-CTERM sorting domain-containing protein [Rubrivivax sp.]